MLKTRVITALILAPIAVGCIFFLPPLGFALFTGIIISIGAWEWANMAGLTQPVGRVLYGLATALILYLLLHTAAVTVLLLAVIWWVVALFLVRVYPGASSVWKPVPARMVMGALVLIPAWVGLNHLRSGAFHLADLDNNLLLLLYVFCVVWIADIGAYFAGRAFGKAKLAPRVSPGKSWAGVWGGLAAVSALSVLVSLLIGCNGTEALLLWLVSLVTGAVSVLGDLLESMLKRFRGIKDSSQLLPGHGGIMDRIDSLTAAIPVFALCITLLGWLQVSPLA